MSTETRSSKQLKAIARLRGTRAPTYTPTSTIEYDRLKGIDRTKEATSYKSYIDPGSGSGKRVYVDNLNRYISEAEARRIDDRVRKASNGKKQVIIGVGTRREGGYYGGQIGKTLPQEQRKQLATEIRKAQTSLKKTQEMDTVRATTQTTVKAPGFMPAPPQMTPVITEEDKPQLTVYNADKKRFSLSDVWYINPKKREETDPKFRNFAETLRASLRLKGVQADKGGTFTRLVMEDLASNPYFTALALTPVGRLAGTTKATSYIGRTLPKIGVGAATGLVSFQTVSTIAGKIGLRKSDSKIVSDRPEVVQPALKEFESSRRDYIKTQPWYKQLADDIPGAMLGYKALLGTTLGKKAQNIIPGLSAKDTAQEVGLLGAERTLRKMGVPESELKMAAKDIGEISRGRRIGEAAAFWATSTAVEIMGRSEFVYRSAKGLFPTVVKGGKTFLPYFREGFKVVAPLGVIEAGTQEIVSQQARLEKIDVSKIVGMAAFGGASAGLIGGAIVGLAQRKTGQKVVEGLAYLGDPYEPLGDIAASGILRGKSAITGAPRLRAGTLVTTITPESITNIFGGRKKAPPIPIQQVTGKGKGVKVPEIGYGATVVKTLEPVKVYEPTVLDGGGGRRRKSPMDIVTGTSTPSDTPTDTETPTDIITDPITTPDPIIDTPTDIITDTKITTPTNILSFTGTPTATPILRYPPPFLPPGIGGIGTGAGKFKGKRRSKFVDEVAAAGAFLQGVSSGNLDFISQVKKKPKKKKKKKKGKKKKKVMKKRRGFDRFGILDNIAFPKI